jgi:glycosyltransferase involved in cell wall biosynthesis
VRLLIKNKKWKPLNQELIDNARRIVEDTSPKPNGSCHWYNPKTEPYKYDLSIIVPFYKTEKYAKKCIDSIINQKCDFSFEILLIDDGSPDNCGKICDEYAQKDNKIKVIHKENGGLSDARNEGIKFAQGEYILFIDSDDYISENSLSILMQTAKTHNADIVEGSFCTFNTINKKKLFAHASNFSAPKEQLFGYAWGKVIKSTLFENFCFPTGFWFEDTIMSALIFPQSKKNITIPNETYCYFINSSGITKSACSNPKCIDTYYILETLFETIQYYNLDVPDSLKTGIVQQLSKYVYNRCQKLKNKNSLKSLFVLCANLANEYNVFSLKNITFWENEVCEALKNKQYYRWVISSIMM